MNRRTFLTALVAFAAAPLAVFRTPGLRFKAGDVLRIDQAGAHNLGPVSNPQLGISIRFIKQWEIAAPIPQRLEFHPDAFRMVTEPLIPLPPHTPWLRGFIVTATEERTS